jgi:predicted flap endonuclease-1-like 5' DNA nuclease
MKSAAKPAASAPPAASAGQKSQTAVPSPVQPAPQARAAMAEETSASAPVIFVPSPVTRNNGLASLATAPRSYLLEADELERAPSIGPKLAERLAAGGFITVGDFLTADTDVVVAVLADSRFDADTIERWKMESRLVLSVPGLRGTHAQLLVGAGFETAEKLAEADPAQLSSALLAFATTPAGARILRHGDAPDVEAVTRWVRFAQQALAA